MPRHLRLPLAVVAAVMAVEVAVWAVRPRDVGPAPVPVAARAYFSEAELARARAYRRPQLALSLLALGLQAGALVLVVRRPPEVLRRPGLRRAAVAGAALAIGLSAVALPVSVIARERARDVGLVTQDWGGYAADVARSWAIEGALAAAAAALLVLAMRRLPRAWPIPVAAGAVAIAVASIGLTPVLLDPLFNRFTPLPPGELRADVMRLAERAGVDVGEVYVMDASRRVTSANAYVAGLGSTKRVVLYDTLLERFSPDQVRLVVAHELAHQRYDDLGGGLLFVAIVAPAGVWLVRELTHRLAPAGAIGTAAALPAFVLALGMVQTPITWRSNDVSRDVEQRADAYALAVTGDAASFIAFQQRIARLNIGDPDPPAWQVALFSTHPPTVERIGLGVRAAAARPRTPAGS